MSGVKSGYRARLFAAIHAEGLKRHFDHDGLHNLICDQFAVHSMADATDHQLEGLYRNWTGHTLRTRAKLPRRGEAAKRAASGQIISAEEVIELSAEFARRNLKMAEQVNFVRRQLRGRDQVRTRADWVRVITPLRAMNRKDGLR